MSKIRPPSRVWESRSTGATSEAGPERRVSHIRARFLIRSRARRFTTAYKLDILRRADA